MRSSPLALSLLTGCVWLSADEHASLLAGLQTDTGAATTLTTQTTPTTDCATPDTWYVDADGDHFGDGDQPVEACEQPEGTAAAAGDCDDADSAVNPGADETPYNGIDDDCEGNTRDDDLDEDGFPHAEDCDDENLDVYPGAEELCDDNADNDCDDLIDECWAPAWVIALRGDHASSEAGAIVRGIGDMNEDSVRDIAVGIPGDDTVALISGQVIENLSADTDISGLAISFEAPYTVDGVGNTIADIGDIDLDGNADLLVGAWESDLAVIMLGGPDLGLSSPRRSGTSPATRTSS